MSHDAFSESDMKNLVEDLKSDFLDEFTSGMTDENVICPYCGGKLKLESAKKAICSDCGRSIPIYRE